MAAIAHKSDPAIPVLEVRNLVKRFGAVEVLKSISIEMNAGDFLVLVGPSGCGKSTLLNCIAGLDEVSGGEIVISGRHVTQVPPRDRDIAMVFQSYALYPTMTVAENIGFGMKVRHVPKAEQEKKIREVSSLLQIQHLLARKPGALSGGSGSAWPWAGRWCASRCCSCSTSRFRTWMRSCAWNCGARSSGCMSGSALLSFT